MINNLIMSGLIKKEENGELKKIQTKLRTTEVISTQAIKESHLETLEMGKKKLEEVEVDLRDFSAMTIALDLKIIPEAKTIIREFRQKMSTLLRDGNKTEVYQQAIQLYSLTNNQY